MRARSRRSMASVNKPSASSLVAIRARERRHRAQAPLGSAGARSCVVQLESRGGGVNVAHMSRGFDQFEQARTEEAEVLVLAAFTRGREGLVIATEPVEQHGCGVLGQSDQSAFPLGGALRGGRLHHVDVRMRPPATPRGSTSGTSLGMLPIEAVIASTSSRSLAAMENSPVYTWTPAR